MADLAGHHVAAAVWRTWLGTLWLQLYGGPGWAPCGCSCMADLAGHPVAVAVCWPSCALGLHRYHTQQVYASPLDLAVAVW